MFYLLSNFKMATHDKLNLRNSYNVFNVLDVHKSKHILRHITITNLFIKAKFETSLNYKQS